MVSRRLRIRQLVACVLFLLVSASALAADTELPFDSRSLVEVHSLESIPKEVISLMGWHREGPDGITDRYDKFNASGAAGSDLPRRHFEAAGVSSAAVVVIYEQAGRPSTYHALAYMMTRSGWSKAGAWDLGDESTHLRGFLYEVDSARYGLAARLYLEDKRRYRVLTRIGLTRPIRRNGPLRKANLSDDEAREIQSVMSLAYPGVLLNISGVVTGCPCEEGPSCSDQVWVVPKDDVKTPGVLLSRISDRWTVGPIQKWWMDRADLEADTRLTRSQREEALYTFWEKFPKCSQTTAPARQ
jgi:hypothetical protein